MFFSFGGRYHSLGKLSWGYRCSFFSLPQASIVHPTISRFRLTATCGSHFASGACTPFWNGPRRYRRGLGRM